ncbi:MAG: hypothetical protein AAFY46_13045, partial [Planctomycetota bacterium]
RTVSTQLAMGSFSIDQMIRYNRSGSVSDEVLEAFRGYAQRQATVNDLEQTLRDLDAESKRLADDQERIRRLMGSLSRQDALHARYLRTLEQHEDRLEAIRGERAETEAERDRKRDELNEYVRGLRVE